MRGRFASAPGIRLETGTTFPEFMKKPSNRIATIDQATPGVEGYVFDGLDVSQMAFWMCHEDATSAAQAHDFDEDMLVVQVVLR